MPIQYVRERFRNSSTTSMRVPGSGAQIIDLVQLATRNLGWNRMIVAHRFDQARVLDGIRWMGPIFSQESPGYKAGDESPASEVQPDPLECITFPVWNGHNIERQVNVMHQPSPDTHRHHDGEIAFH